MPWKQTMDRSLHQPRLACLPKRGFLNTEHHLPPMRSQMGKQKNAVQTVKRLFKKCKTSGDQNSKHFLTSAVHQCKTLLPVADYLLQPSYPTGEDTTNSKLIGNKQRQKFYYNKHRKPLEPIVTGDTVQMKLPRHGPLARVWARSHVTLISTE